MSGVCIWFAEMAGLFDESSAFDEGNYADNV